MPSQRMLLLTTMEHVRRARLPQTQTVASITLSFKQASRRSDPSGARSTVNMLKEVMLSEELFHTAGGVAYADFIAGGRRESWPIRSKQFRIWLRRCYYHATGAAASSAAIGAALDLLEARAQFDSPERTVSIRVAEHADCVYLDLADEHWRAVEIGADGWRVLERSPVRFRRAPGMLPLPVPERGGSIEALRSFLNLSSQNDFILVVAWLLAALRPAGPYPLLTITGE